MKILVINGSNLNLLGERDKNYYGAKSLDEIKQIMNDEFPGNSIQFFQSNIEGEIINEIQGAARNFDGIIINPGGYAHTSVSIKDALEVCSLPKVEVHLSNIAGREDFRKISLTASGCDGYISGFKEYSYLSALYILNKLITSKHD